MSGLPSLDYQAIFEACPACLVVLESIPPEFRIIAATDEYLASTLSKRENLIGHGVFEVFCDNPENNDAEGCRNFKASLTRVLETLREDTKDVQRYDIPDPQSGQFLERHWRSTNKPVFDANGKITAIIHQTEDITEFIMLKRQGLVQDTLTQELRHRSDCITAELFQREAERLEACRALQISEQALRDANARLSLTLRASRIGTWTFDIRTQIFFWDDLMRQLLDPISLEREATTTYPQFLRLLHPDDQPLLPSDALDALSASQLLDRELRIVGKDGDFRYLSIRGEQIDSGRLAGIAVDITSQKILECERLQALEQRAEMLAEVDRHKNAFLSHISHEFRTPLTLMLAPLQESLSDKDEPLSSKQEWRQRLIMRNAVQVLRQVNQLLAFTRTQNACNDTHLEPLDLPQLTSALASTFRPLIEDSGLQYRVDVEPMSKLILMDREHYEKILLNLLSNAFKFTLSGSIKVALREVDQQVELTVSDTGVGISPDDAPCIFDRFYRGCYKKARTFEGSGIGLALTKQLVENHSGTIRFEPMPDQGTSFIVTLPIRWAEEPSVERASKHTFIMHPVASNADQFLAEASQWVTQANEALMDCTSPGANNTILVVDDSHDMRVYLAELLTVLGPVMTAADASRALQVAQAVRPALIVLDVMLRDMSGLDLLKIIKADQNLEDIPVVLLSAQAEPDSAVQGLETAADDYIAKPFSVRELLARLRVRLDLSRSQRKLKDQLYQRSAELNDVSHKLAASKSVVLQQAKTQARIQGRLVAEEQRSKLLQQYKQMQEDFIDTLCHELRNPLNGLIGTVDILDDFLVQASTKVRGLHSTVEGQSKTPPPTPEGNSLAGLMEESRRCVDSLRACCSHSKSILDDVLDVSKLESHKVVMNPIPTNVLAKLETSLGMFRSSAQQKDVKLHLVPPKDPKLTVLLDGHRLAQVIINLLSNAVKFTPKDGEITLSATFKARIASKGDASPSKGVLLLSVQDSGPGMTKDEVGRLFDRFAQANVQVGASYGGSGLGLYITKSLVSLMGGDISVSSQPGEGSCFSVSIPCQVADPIPEPTSPSSAPALSCKEPSQVSVLVVEDNAINQRLLKVTLQQNGYHQCDIANNGQKAVEAWRAKQYDVILMDIEMPVMDGITATKEIRRLEGALSRCRTCIIGVSGHTSEHHIAATKSAGMDGYLTKPYARDQILLTLCKATQISRGSIVK